jgi:hypothetical protein
MDELVAHLGLRPKSRLLFHDAAAVHVVTDPQHRTLI